jgi:hypothetical protein
MGASAHDRLASIRALVHKHHQRDDVLPADLVDEVYALTDTSDLEVDAGLDAHDLALRLAAADVLWSRECGDATHTRPYLEYLARTALALRPETEGGDR